MRGAGECIAIAALLLAGCEEVPRTYSTRGHGGTEIFRDDFERTELGPSWFASGEGVWLENGVVKLRDTRNHPLWLAQRLPDDLRIEFDAWAASEEGDVKVELCGDGSSLATSMNYVATGYVVIFGGWNNTLDVIARKNEHGRDRVTASEPLVDTARRYHFAITRSGGELVWEVDGKEVLSLDDPAPLRGTGHDHFAFSGWEAETHFDNLVIEAL
jgi:hypothetical protein